MNTTLLADKRLLITGVVNTDSIAYATATAALAAGAEIALSSLGRDLEAAQLAAESLPGDVEVIEADLTDADHLHRLTDHLDARWGRLDGALHAVAFAPREALAGDFLAAGSAQVSRAFETSTHSYASIASVLATLAPERGGSMVGLDFDAAGAWPVYNWMGVCKAGLEAVNRYVARDLGPRRIRSNLVAAGPIHTRIAIVAYPRISNLDEFQPLKNIPGVAVSWARSASDLIAADWVILPGSKHTSGDLAWLRAQGLDAAIAAHVHKGGRVLGICGGLQMLGEALIDPHGIDGNAPGLGLLPVVTLFEPAKTVRHRQAVFAPLAGPWAPLSGVALQGYEIHHGQTARHPAMAAGGDVAREVLQGGLGWQSANGQVLGLYLHGMFEDPAVLQALFGAQAPTLDTVFDGLADFVDAHIGHDTLMALLQVKRKNGA